MTAFSLCLLFFQQQRFIRGQKPGIYAANREKKLSGPKGRQPHTRKVDWPRAPTMLSSKSIFAGKYSLKDFSRERWTLGAGLCEHDFFGGFSWKIIFEHFLENDVFCALYGLTQGSTLRGRVGRGGVVRWGGGGEASDLLRAASAMYIYYASSSMFGREKWPGTASVSTHGTFITC